MAEIWSGRTVASYGAWQGPAGQQGDRVQVINEAPPGRTGTSLRWKLLDGDRSQHIAADFPNRERAQYQVRTLFPGVNSGVPVASRMRWLAGWLRCIEIAQGELDWHLLWQIHTAGASVAAPLNLAVNGTETLIRHTPSGFAHQYPSSTRRPQDPGVYHWHAIGYLPDFTQGRIVYKRDAETLLNHTGRTVDDGADSYPVIGSYRTASCNGRDLYDTFDLAVYDTEPMFPGSTPPPPPAQDTAPPVAQILAPAAGERISGTFTLRASVVDFGNPASGVERGTWRLNDGMADVYTLTEESEPWEHPLDTTAISDGDYELSFTPEDVAANTGEPYRVDVSIDNVAEPPPPPPPPADPCAGIRAERDAANDRALAAENAQAAAEATLASVRSNVAAETQRHGQAIAEALEG